MSRVRLTVTGIVQGVGFRYFAKRTADRLGVTGWVKNRPDGSVEIEANAVQAILDDFIRDVQSGPVSSRVTGVDIHRIEPAEIFDTFEIRF